MPTMRFACELPCTAEKAWEDFCRPTHLIAISAPLLKIEPLDKIPESYSEGLTLRTRLHMFGKVPWGEHTIEMVKLNSGAKCLETREYGNNITSWKHRFQIVPVTASSCRCSDEIVFEAGAFTSFVWVYSQVLYRLRYSRWKKILRGSNGL